MPVKLKLGADVAAAEKLNGVLESGVLVLGVVVAPNEKTAGFYTHTHTKKKIEDLRQD